MLPNITHEDIREFIIGQKPECEVFLNYPSDITKVSSGIYVNKPIIVGRSIITKGFGSCGTISDVTEEFNVLWIGTQHDKSMDISSDIITNLPYADILKGYHDISYTLSREYGASSEIRTYTFTLVRNEIT